MATTNPVEQPRIEVPLEVGLIGVDRAFARDVRERLGVARGFARVHALSGSQPRDLGRCRVLLVDADRSRTDGLGWLEVLRERRQDIACLVLATDPSRVELLAFLRAGVSDVLPKPADATDVARAIRRVVEPNRGADTVGAPGHSLEVPERVNRQLRQVNQALRQHVSQLTILYQLGRDISETENWSDALDRFLMALVSYTEAEGAALLLFSERGRRLAPRASFQVEAETLKEVSSTVLAGWAENPRRGEIHPVENYRGAAFAPCLESPREWRLTLIPLQYRGRDIGFVLIDKRYRNGAAFKADYHFFTTLQTIMAEEVSNATYISELRQLGRFNQKVLDNITSGVLTTDLEGYVRFFNACAADLCPRLRSAPALHFNELFDAPAVCSDLYSYVMKGGSEADVLSMECVMVQEEFPTRLRLTRMHDDNLNGPVLLAIFEDLTDQKRFEAERRRHDRLRLLGQVSAGVAHEIRNPLTGIATSAEVLGRKLKGDEQKERYTRAIVSETHRLDGIIRNLLQYAKPPRLQLAACDVREIIAKVVELLAEQARTRGVELACAGDADEAVCQADRNQLTQVLLNLVLNGIHACDESGHVKLSARREAGAAPHNGTICIDVEDTGSGVPPEVRESLFDPFVTTKADGTGLGLAISQQIIEEHGGSITYEALERGTRFSIRLPAVAAPTPADKS